MDDELFPGAGVTVSQILTPHGGSLKQGNVPLSEPEELFPGAGVTVNEVLFGKVAGMMGKWKDPVNALKQIPRDLGSAARNVGAYSAGLMGDIDPMIGPGGTAGDAINAMGITERDRVIPNSDELMDKFGDREHWSNVPAMVASPGPGEIAAAGKMALGGAKMAGNAMLAAAPLAKTASTVVKPAIKAKAFTPKSTKTAIKDFQKNLDDARSKMTKRDAAQVDALPDDFVGTVYMTEDGKVGFSMTKDGYIGHLYKSPDAEVSGVMEAALIKARAAGAKNLDAFDTGLAKGYANRGAVETGRSPWNDDLASPEVANALGPTKPDFVAMDVGGYVPERKHSQLAGPREQESMPRYTETPTGRPVAKPESMNALTTKQGSLRAKNKRELTAHATAGIEKGGDKWYHLGGLKDRFIEAWDDVAVGAKEFDRFMDYNAALSPRSKVAQNIKRASYLFWREKRGLSNKGITKETFPPGYGDLATPTQKHSVNRLMDSGKVGDSALQPKISSYTENLKGNYKPLTADSHNNLLVTGREGSPTIGEYPHMEAAEVELATELGLDPAEFQSAVWVGGEEITGVADSRNYTAAINQRIAKTAEVLEVSEKEAFRLFAKGDEYLRSVILIIGAGALAEGVRSTEEETGA